MKKILLFSLALGITLSTVAQSNFGRKVSTKAPNNDILMEAPANSGMDVPVESDDAGFETVINGKAASFIPIGITGNAYGYYSNPRTYIWADPMINSIVFTHRMTGGTEVEGNSRVAYDVSTDGGATWTNNVQAYTPLGEDPGSGYPLAAGRYPMGAIINPDGNTNPADAFYSYFFCTLDNTNGNWGGYAYGTNALTMTDPPAPTQHNVTTENGVFRLIPDAYHVTPQGVAWYMDGNYPTYDGGGTYEYNGEVILGRGELNDDGDIVSTEELIPFLEVADGINDHKIVFGDDGMTGFILLMSDIVSDPTPYTSFHPVMLKTTDGGESWSDPIDVQLGGEDGIESLKNYFTDEAILGAGYPEGFDRDEVYYNMGFQVDIALDMNDNPYITGVIAIGDADGWYPNETQMATFNLFSEDGGMTWDAHALYDNIWLQGDIGAIVQYNRPYVSRTYDGHYLFFSWIDSDIDVATQNDRPNIYVVGYDVEDHTYSEVMNVTYFTQGWNMAFYGSQSYYVFSDLDEEETMWTCRIPFVYEEFTVPGDDTQQCNFWYVDGYEIDMPVGNSEIAAETFDFSVQQNFPNPASTQTSVLVNAQTDLPIEFSVSNLLGQSIYADVVDSRAMAHTFKVNVTDFTPGIYLYTVKIGNDAVTKKMIVE